MRPLILIAAVCSCLPLAPVAAQSDTNRADGSSAPERSFELPTDPAMWVNGTPLSLESLKGKGAVMLFYEEGCPKCAGKWPALGEFAAKHRGEPVVFIAINSGNSRREVEMYAKRNQVSWPIVVDSSRTLERQALGDTQISLNNIMQMLYLTADGEVKPGYWSDAERTYQLAREGAAWRVDPEIVPPKLRDAWMHVELGNFAAAASTLRRYQGRGDEKAQAAAEAMSKAVTKEMNAALATAKDAMASGDHWAAYQQLSMVITKYKGYDLPDTVKTELKGLERNDAVREEIKQQKRLLSAKKALASGGRGMKRAVSTLRKLIEAAPDSAAAAEAQSILASIDEA